MLCGRQPGLDPIALIPEGFAQTAMSFGKVRLELDGRAVGRDRLIQLSLIPEGVAQVGMGFGIVGLELDGSVIGFNRLIQLS